MYHVFPSREYKKSLKKLAKNTPNAVREVEIIINALKKGLLLPVKYQDHKLRGDFEGYRECHLRPDILLVYQIKDKELILVLIDIGSHAYLFE